MQVTEVALIAEIRAIQNFFESVPDAANSAILRTLLRFLAVPVTPVARSSTSSVSRERAEPFG